MSLVNLASSAMEAPSLMQQLSMPGQTGVPSLASGSLPSLMAGAGQLPAASAATGADVASLAALSASAASASKSTPPLSGSTLSGSAALSLSTAAGGASGLSPPGAGAPAGAPTGAAGTGTVSVPLTDRFYALNPLGPQALTPLQQYQQRVLDGVVRRLPVPADTQRANRFVPRLASPPYPSSYPTVPLPNSDSLDFFLKLQPETLFFIFYYYQVSSFPSSCCNYRY